MRRGDDRAFEELYDRYRRRIGSYVFGMVGDHGRAEDISQEVFISALRRMRDTERPIAFKPWLYEIAKNACIDHFRRARRAEEVPLDADDTLQSNKLTLAGTPQTAVESKQQLDDLRGAFGGLSESHHQVLVMRELEGLSYSEIGERLGMSRAVVESTLFRARKRLTEEYDELVSGRRCERVREVVAAERGRSLQGLGIRERRRLARHLSHCQPCRRHAHMAGFDDSVLQTPGLAGRIAALLPIPWLRARLGERDGNVVAASGTHSMAIARSVQTASRFVDSLGPSVGAGRMAAAAAVLAIAGTGGGLMTAGGSGPARKATVSHTAARRGHQDGHVSGAAGTSALQRGAATKAGAAGPSSKLALTAQARSAGGGARGPAAAGGQPSGAGGGGTGAAASPSGGGSPSTPAGSGAASGAGWVAKGGPLAAAVGAVGATGAALNGVTGRLSGGSHPQGSAPPSVSLPNVSIPRITLPSVNQLAPIPLPTLPQLPPLPSLPNLSSLVPPLPVVGKLHLPG